MKLLSCLTALFLACSASALAENVPLESERWNITADAYRFETVDGRKSLFLNNGRAVLKDAVFENGVIEYDVKFPDQRGFVGVRFRRQDAGNHEDFYIRTHQSGNPDANQYTPTFNRLSAWQIYYGPQYATPIEYNHNEWTHVKLVILNDRADIYVESEEPILHVADLKRDQKSGALELWTNVTAAHFANFNVVATNEVELVGTAEPEADLSDGHVRRWLVSEAFSPDELENMLTLDAGLEGRLHWSELEVETKGPANLARVVVGERGKNATLAKITVGADRAMSKRFRFGFSDAARVYFNGRLLYDGNDVYGSRDYRFLGTVGLYDALYLPLKKGRNEIVIAVSEQFGGWAVNGAFDSLDGIEISP